MTSIWVVDNPQGLENTKNKASRKLVEVLIDCALFYLIKISISFVFPAERLSPSPQISHCSLSLSYNYAYGFTPCSCLLRHSIEYLCNQRLCFKDNQYRCLQMSLNITPAHL